MREKKDGMDRCWKSFKASGEEGSEIVIGCFGERTEKWGPVVCDTWQVHDAGAKDPEAFVYV